MKLSRAVQEFLAERRTSMAASSVVAYESDLHRLVALAAPDSVLSFTTDLVRAYFIGLSQQGRSMSTLHRKWACISEFARWGVRRSLWVTNPMDAMPNFKRPEHLPRPFNPEERDRLMTLELPPKERVLRALLYFTGLRVTPICQIKLGDLSFTTISYPDGVTLPGSIRTLNKGRRELVVPMHPELKEFLLDYTLKASDLKGQTYLLQNSRGRPYTRRLVEKATHRWGKLAGVPDCLPHRFRHSFATDLLRMGVDVRVIQKLLGHASLTSTVIYTKVADAQAAAAVLKLARTEPQPRQETS